MSRKVSGYYSGLAAEDIAAQAYEAEGGRILSRRWRCPEGEIDLIVSLNGEVIFAEVKARKTHDLASASVSRKQWQRIGAAATMWLAENSDGSVPCRFDLVLVDGKGIAERIENAAGFDEW